MAVSRIDVVVQQLDKKFEQGVNALSDRISQENGAMDGQLGRVTGRVDEALQDTARKLETLAHDVQQFVLTVGADKAGTKSEVSAMGVRVDEVRSFLLSQLKKNEVAFTDLQSEMTEARRQLTSDLDAFRLETRGATLESHS